MLGCEKGGGQMGFYVLLMIFLSLILFRMIPSPFLLISLALSFLCSSSCLSLPLPPLHLSLTLPSISSFSSLSQDLLQLQYEGVAVMKLFDRATINVNLLIFLLNKKFYGK